MCIALFVVPAGKVFKAVQAHWLSACMGVMLELHVADVLLGGTKTNGKHQQGMHIDEVRARQGEWLHLHWHSSCMLTQHA